MDRFQDGMMFGWIKDKWRVDGDWMYGFFPLKYISSYYIYATKHMLGNVE